MTDKNKHKNTSLSKLIECAVLYFSIVHCAVTKNWRHASGATSHDI